MPDVAHDLPFESAIATQSLRFSDLTIAERAHTGLLMLQTSPADPVRKAAGDALGLALPERPNTTALSDSLRALWLWPRAWLLQCDQAQVAKLRSALATNLDASSYVAVDVSHAYTTVTLEGQNALQFLLPLSTLQKSALASGRCARTLLGDVPVVIVTTTQGLDVLVDRSLARFFWAWLAEHAHSP